MILGYKDAEGYADIQVYGWVDVIIESESVFIPKSSDICFQMWSPCLLDLCVNLFIPLNLM